MLLATRMNGMSMDTSKLLAFSALSASLCLITSIVAYCTWSRLHSKRTKTTKHTKRKKAKKKKNKTANVQQDGHPTTTSQTKEYSAEEEEDATKDDNSGWTQVRPRRRKSKKGVE